MRWCSLLFRRGLDDAAARALLIRFVTGASTVKPAMRVACSLQGACTLARHCTLGRSRQWITGSSLRRWHEAFLATRAGLDAAFALRRFAHRCTKIRFSSQRRAGCQHAEARYQRRCRRSKASQCKSKCHGLKSNVENCQSTASTSCKTHAFSSPAPMP